MKLEPMAQLSTIAGRGICISFVSNDRNDTIQVHSNFRHYRNITIQLHSPPVCAWRRDRISHQCLLWVKFGPRHLVHSEEEELFYNFITD